MFFFIHSIKKRYTNLTVQIYAPPVFGVPLHGFSYHIPASFNSYWKSSFNFSAKASPRKFSPTITPSALIRYIVGTNFTL